MADDITVRVGLDARALLEGINEIAAKAQQRLSSLSTSVAGGQAVAAPASQQVFSGIGQLYGAGQSEIRQGDISTSERNRLLNQLRVARGETLGTAQTSGLADVKNVQALYSAQKETFAQEKARLEGQKKISDEMERQAALARGQSTNLTKFNQINSNLESTFRPVLGPQQSAVEQQARAQIAAGRERLAVEKEINRIHLNDPQNDLTRIQRAQLQSNVLFGRRNLEGLPPTGGELLTQSVATIGRYAVAGAGIYAVTNGIKQAVDEAGQFQIVMGHLQVQLETIGQGDQLKGLRTAIFDIAKNTGSDISDIANLTSQFVGAFAGTTGDQVGGAKQATEIAAQLGVLADIKPGEIFNDLVAGMRAFADAGTSAAQVQAIQNIADITTTISEVSGVPIKELADFLGRIGPVAKTAGLSLKETSAIGAALLQGSGVGGAGLGEQFGRILTDFSKTSAPAIALLVEQVPQIRAALNPQELTEFNAALSNSDPTVLIGLAKGFSTLSAAQQQNIIQSVAGRREGATLAALLQNSITLTSSLAASQTASGRAQEEFTKRQDQFKQKLAQLKTVLLEVGIAIANSGFLGFATDLLSILTQLVKPLATVIGYFNDIPESVRKAAISIGLASVAFKLISPAGGGAGAASIVGPGISGIVRGGAANESGGFLAGLVKSGGAGLAGLAKGLVPFLPAVGGQVAGSIIDHSSAGKTAQGSLAAGAVRGAGIGATFGLLGGPLDAITVPGGALAGGLIGGLAGLAGHKDKVQTTDLGTLSQKDFAAVSDQFKNAMSSKSFEALKKLDELNKKYPGLAKAVQDGTTLVKNLPDVIAKQIEDTSKDLDDVIAEYQNGTATLGEVNRAFAQNEKALEGLKSPEAAKLLQAIKSQDQKLNDAALKRASDYQEDLANTTGDGTPEATVTRLRTLLAQTKDPGDRASLGTDLLKAEKEVLNTQVAIAQAAGNTQEALRLLREGIPIPNEDRAVIIETQLNDYTGAFQTFLDGMVVAGIAIPDGLIATMTGIIAAGGDAIATMRAILIDKLNGFIASAVSVFLATGGDGGGSDAKSIAGVQAQIDALNNLPTNFGISAPTRIKGSATEIANATKAGNDQAKAISDARADLAKAYIENDPVALAQFNIADADRQASVATTEAEKIQAQAAKVRAERSLGDAINAVFQSKISLFQAVLESNGDIIGAVNAGVALANAQLDAARANGSGEAAINNAEAGVIQANAKLRDTVLNEGISDFQFAVDMKEKTTGEFVAYLKSLLVLPTITKQQRQQISEQIKQLSDTLGQSSQFNLPEFLGLPTLYEQRRLDQTGGGYQDNRRIIITLNATNAVDGQAAINQIVDVLNGPSRYGTTPRLY